MRTKAFILFFPFTVFLTETASFIPAMKTVCAVVSAEKTACSKIQKQGKCHKQKDAGKKKTSGNTCNDKPDCTSCPVCYTFIFQPQYEWSSAGQFILKKNYSLLNTNYTYYYCPTVWKPPDVLA